MKFPTGAKLGKSMKLNTNMNTAFESGKCYPWWIWSASNVIHTFDIQIMSLKKEIFSKYVKKKMEINAFKYLKGNSKSKTTELDFGKLSQAEYLATPELKIEEIKNLYKIRNRMIDVKDN